MDSISKIAEELEVLANDCEDAAIEAKGQIHAKIYLSICARVRYAARKLAPDVVLK
jgi:hypothetical protein